MSGKLKTIKFDAECIEKAKKVGTIENRNFSNLANVAMKKYCDVVLNEQSKIK